MILSRAIIHRLRRSAFNLHGAESTNDALGGGVETLVEFDFELRPSGMERSFIRGGYLGLPRFVRPLSFAFRYHRPRWARLRELLPPVTLI